MDGRNQVLGNIVGAVLHTYVAKHECKTFSHLLALRHCQHDYARKPGVSWETSGFLARIRPTSFAGQVPQDNSGQVENPVSTKIYDLMIYE